MGTRTDYTGMTDREVKEDWADLQVHLSEYQIGGHEAPEWLGQALDHCRLEMEERGILD